MRKRTAYALMLGITLTTVGTMLCLPKESARAVRARSVEVGSVIEETVEGGGVMGQSGEYTVSSLSGGVVAQVFVTANQRVEAGQALFRLDSTEEERALSTALRAEADAAQNQNNALDSVAQASQDFEGGAQWLAEAQAGQARQQVETLQARISTMTVRAMDSGDVLATYIQAGEVLLPGAPALTLAQAQQVVRMQVGERESLRLKEGLRARFLRDDALLGEGTVTSVGMPTSRQDGVLSVDVELAPDQPIALPTGSRLDVEIVCRAQEDATLVPLEALVDGAVWQVFEQRAWRIPVGVGLQDALHAAVEGLPEDALVILQPPLDLREGELVEVNPS